MDIILYNKLIKAYKKHGSLIVGVDFDDTIFPYSKEIENVQRCAEVVALLQNLKKNLGVDLILCLFSVADKQSLIYKEHIMDLYDLKPEFINEGPVDSKWNSKKPYFNILLDDKAGLNSTMETLSEFITYLENKDNE